MDERRLPNPGTGQDPPASPWDAGGSHEIALRELLRSPLDEPRRRRGAPGRGFGIALVIFLVAAAVGAGLTVGGAALAGSEAATTTAAATTTTATTTSVPAVAGPALPAGYHPLGEGFGGRVERVLIRPDAALVTISMAVDEDHDPETTVGHQGGGWVLEFPDGTALASLDVTFDAVAPGTATIVFPSFTQDPSTAVLRLAAARELTTQALSTSVAATVAALPVEGAQAFDLSPTEFDLAGVGTLRLGQLTLTAAGAELPWSVTGDAVTAAVAPVVVLEGAAVTVLLVPEDPFAPFRNRMLSIPFPTLGTAGSVVLIPDQPTVRDPGVDFTVTVLFEVTWGIITVAADPDADAVLPVAGADIVFVGPEG